MNEARKTTTAIVQVISADLGFDASEPDDLIDNLLERGPAKTTLVLDAIDEADDPHEVWTDVLAPLVVRGGVQGQAAPRHSPKSLRYLHASRTLDLDAPDYFQKRDVADYVTGYLLGPGPRHYRGKLDAATRLGRQGRGERRPRLPDRAPRGDGTRGHHGPDQVTRPVSEHRRRGPGAHSQSGRSILAEAEAGRSVAD